MECIDGIKTHRAVVAKGGKAPCERCGVMVDDQRKPLPGATRFEFLPYSLALRQACRAMLKTDPHGGESREAEALKAMLCDMSHEQVGELMRLAVVELLQMPHSPIRLQPTDLGAINAAHMAGAIKALKA